MALQSTTALASITLQSSASEIVLSAIPNIYRDLILVINGSYTGGTEGYFYLDFNLDTVSSYGRVDMYGNGSTASSGAFANLIPITLGNTTTLNITQIIDYSATDKHKSILTRNNKASDFFALTGRWANTAAINSIRIRPFSSYSISAGTNISLYGRVA